MTKQRIQGRVTGGMYEIVATDGSVISQTPLQEARGDKKLAAAIKRNGWEGIPDGE